MTRINLYEITENGNSVGIISAPSAPAAFHDYWAQHIWNANPATKVKDKNTWHFTCGGKSYTAKKVAKGRW